MDWKQLSEAFSGAADIFTLGRLVFYTAAGALFVYPAAAGLCVLSSTLGGHPFAELASMLPTMNLGAMLFSSTVAGFLIAGFGFVRVLSKVDAEAKRRAHLAPVDRRSYPFRYRQLRGGESLDCNAWLIQEYFRFVEIVTYVPLGLLAGLGALLLYSIAYVLAWAATGNRFTFGEPHAALGVAASTFTFLAYFVWPRLWVPGVVVPVLEVYHRAKVSIISALDEGKPSRTATKPQA
jgi:hypothetical protein